MQQVDEMKVIALTRGDLIGTVGMNSKPSNYAGMCS